MTCPSNDLCQKSCRGIQCFFFFGGNTTEVPYVYYIASYLSGEPLENGSIMVSKSKFDTKIEASSAQMYFHYYGQLLHQQNMLQDFVRTGKYLFLLLNYPLN
jgi:hypothetical protein